MSRMVVLGATITMLVAACGSDAASTCTELREPEDPASVRHVVGEIDFEYLSDPPTSGPHVGGAAPTGVLEASIAAPVQVRILEDGHAIVQYDPQRIDGDDVDGFVVSGAVVAPAENLSDPLIVTAWTWKLTCSEVDTDRIDRFIGDRTSDAPGQD